MITFIITFDEQVVQVSSGTNELSELVNSSETPLTNSRFRAHSLSKTWNSQVPAGTDRSLATGGFRGGRGGPHAPPPPPKIFKD